MLFLTRVLAGEFERFVVLRQGRFATILKPGAHYLAGLGISLERYSILDPVFESRWAAWLLNERPTLTDEHFHVVATGETDVALVYRDGQLERVQGPAKKTLVWKDRGRLTVELVSVADSPLAPPETVRPLRKLAGAPVAFAQIEDGKAGLLTVGGRLSRVLTPGTYALFDTGTPATIEVADLRVQTLEIPGQEILTSDKVSIRVNIWAEYQIVDPVLARESIKNPAEHLYKVVQLAVRQTLARRTLDELLASRTDLDATVEASVREQALAYGIRVGAIAIKDIIPPGEVRDMLNSVVAAEKRALAHLIERREETAATRSLLNTARLLAENPLLVRLKELEVLERVATKVEKIQLGPDIDNLLSKLVVIDRSKDR